MNCEKCGSDNLETAIICISCGNSIFGASQAEKPKPDSIVLWSPDKAALFSWFLFTAIFGATIHALNWKKLGENKKALYSWLWAIGIFLIYNIASLFAGINQYGKEDLNALMILIHPPITLIWYFGFGRSQSKFLVQKYENGYTKNDWLIPFCIAAIITGVLLWFGAYVGTETRFEKY